MINQGTEDKTFPTASQEYKRNDKMCSPLTYSHILSTLSPLSICESNKMPAYDQSPGTGNTVYTTEIWRQDNSSD